MTDIQQSSAFDELVERATALTRDIELSMVVPLVPRSKKERALMEARRHMYAAMEALGRASR